MSSKSKKISESKSWSHKMPRGEGDPSILSQRRSKTLSRFILQKPKCASQRVGGGGWGGGGAVRIESRLYLFVI